MKLSKARPALTTSWWGVVPTRELTKTRWSCLWSAPVHCLTLEIPSLKWRSPGWDSMAWNHASKSFLPARVNTIFWGGPWISLGGVGVRCRMKCRKRCRYRGDWPRRERKQHVGLERWTWVDIALWPAHVECVLFVFDCEAEIACLHLFHWLPSDTLGICSLHSTQSGTAQDDPRCRSPGLGRHDEGAHQHRPSPHHCDQLLQEVWQSSSCNNGIGGTWQQNCSRRNPVLTLVCSPVKRMHGDLADDELPWKHYLCILR